MEPLTPGVTVDRYRLVAPLGSGGQGSVWRAEDPLHNNAPVALKLISLHLVGPAEIDRFRREARVLARFSHPSLPRCHAFFEDLHRDVLGFALDLVEGSPLQSLADAAELTRAHRVFILRHLADALRYIHEAGLVHRDVKLENLMIDRSFFSRPSIPTSVKLVDFGIAAAPLNPTPITAPGSVMGTIEFLAPELVDRGFWKGPVDGPERDIFAFGVLAYELAKGRHPTGLPAGASMGDYLIAYRQMVDNGAWPPDVAGDPLEEFYRRCLALRSEARAQDGAAALELLQKAEAAPVLVTVTSPVLGTSAVQLEGARTELVGPSAVTEGHAMAADRARSRRIYAAFFGLGVAGFLVSFAVAYSRPTPPPSLTLPSALPIPRLPILAASGGQSPDGKARYFDDGAPPGAALAGPLNTVRGASVAEAGKVTCPGEMILVSTGSQSFCIDQREVTVSEYRQCLACGPAKDVFWPNATPAEMEAHAKNCTGNRPGMDDKPITCVTWFDANQYCASRQRRLPRMDELRLARSGVSSCQNVPQACPLFEWSLDTAPHKSHPTRGPSWRYRDAFEGSNPEGASNDDLGFRCAGDPIPSGAARPR